MHILPCWISMCLMGMIIEDLIDGVEAVGLATIAPSAINSNTHFLLWIDFWNHNHPLSGWLCIHIWSTSSNVFRRTLQKAFLSLPVGFHLHASQIKIEHSLHKHTQSENQLPHFCRLIEYWILSFSLLSHPQYVAKGTA